MKHVPQRSCIVCREKRDKSELVRIVRSPEGDFSIDVTGKKPGRGAYVCGSGECMAAAAKKRALDRVYKTKIDADVYASLMEQYKGIRDER